MSSMIPVSWSASTPSTRRPDRTSGRGSTPDAPVKASADSVREVMMQVGLRYGCRPPRGSVQGRPDPTSNERSAMAARRHRRAPAGYRRAHRRDLHRPGRGDPSAAADRRSTSAVTAGGRRPASVLHAPPTTRWKPRPFAAPAKDEGSWVTTATVPSVVGNASTPTTFTRRQAGDPGAAWRADDDHGPRAAQARPRSRRARHQCRRPLFVATG